VKGAVYVSSTTAVVELIDASAQGCRCAHHRKSLASVTFDAICSFQLFVYAKVMKRGLRIVGLGFGLVFGFGSFAT